MAYFQSPPWFRSMHCGFMASVSTVIFKTHDLSFADHQEIAFLEKTPFGNSGFFSAPYGDYWRFIKKLCMTELLSTGQLERSRAVREKELEHGGKHKLLEKGDEAERSRKIMRDTFRFGSNVFFGNMLGPFGILAFWLFGKQAIREQLRIDELLEGMLKEHEDQIGKKDTQDFMDILLKVYQMARLRSK
ncbi:cytochrome p450 705a20 [Quercus suber]|uniref:Cytochrome p450 705a20 n=1 Tax=Quercus suber TaxID=58331 RepID=A0AAW0L693_QUESU